LAANAAGLPAVAKITANQIGCQRGQPIVSTASSSKGLHCWQASRRSAKAGCCCMLLLPSHAAALPSATFTASKATYSTARLRKPAPPPVSHDQTARYCAALAEAAALCLRDAARHRRRPRWAIKSWVAKAERPRLIISARRRRTIDKQFLAGRGSFVHSRKPQLSQKASSPATRARCRAAGRQQQAV
jgi:hypothetical protein